MMCWTNNPEKKIQRCVSVAGCLGYDVLVKPVALIIMR
jgi:hypothetical protein